MSRVTLPQVEVYCERLRLALKRLCGRLGPIQIGNKQQFPDGWGKAAKGRTVWRIVEEAINQNLKSKRRVLGFEEVSPSEHEASIFDVVVRFSGDNHKLHLNFKAAVKGRETEKGDISKAEKLIEFFEGDSTSQLFIVTFVINFHDNDMSIKLVECLVTPIAWLPDIYVNPSNNGNLQCRQPKTLHDAVPRTNRVFIGALKREMRKADAKRRAKSQRQSSQ